MIQLKLNNKKMYVDGKEVLLDAAPLLVNDSRTMVPIRAIAEGFGFTVEWDGEEEVVTIYNRRKYFDTIDAAAYDFGMYWNAYSIGIFKEVGAVIYKAPDGRYYWDKVREGKDKEVVFNSLEAKKGVALIHTHSGGKHSLTKTMSYADFNVAKKYKRPMYMADSGGCLWVYEPGAEKPKQVLIGEGLPCDGKYMDTTESVKLMTEYFKEGYGNLEEYDFGFKADYYNKLYMKG